MYPIFIPMIVSSGGGSVSLLAMLLVLSIVWYALSWFPFIMKATLNEFDDRKQFVIYLINSFVNPFWLFYLAVKWIINKIKELPSSKDN